MANNLQPSSADVMESGSLKLPESSWPHRAVMGLDWKTGIAATELPLRVHLDLKLAGRLWAAIYFRPSTPEALSVKRHQSPLLARN
jgi:hypothetical protein